MSAEPSLSTVVMTHPRRLDGARRLARGLDGPVDVVVDPDPGGPPSALRTAVEAWTRCPYGASHHLVLQDDVLPAKNLVAHALRCVRQHPERIVALYANSQSWNGAAARPALLAGYHWIATTPGEYFPTLATIMPCAAAHAFAEHARAVRAVDPNDDATLSRFIAEHGHRTALRLPNLVEHDEQPSLMGYDSHGIRRSVVFDETVQPEADGPLLETLPAWPAFLLRRARLRLPPRPGGTRWRTLTRTAHLRLLDVDWAEVVTAAEAVLQQLPRLPQRRAAARRYLRELHLAALTLGWVVASIPAGRPGGDAYRAGVLRSYVEVGFGYEAALAPWRGYLDLLVDMASSAVDRFSPAGRGGPPAGSR